MVCSMRRLASRPYLIWTGLASCYFAQGQGRGRYGLTKTKDRGYCTYWNMPVIEGPNKDQDTHPMNSKNSKNMVSAIRPHIRALPLLALSGLFLQIIHMTNAKTPRIKIGPI